MPRRGERKPKTIPGDPTDPAGFPALVSEFLESMGVRGYSPRTIENHLVALGYLAAWLSERGIGRPAEVTKPMLDGYQRALFHRRKPDGTPALVPGAAHPAGSDPRVLQMARAPEPDPLQPRQRARAAQARTPTPTRRPLRG
jgi:hypothetical protein